MQKSLTDFKKKVEYLLDISKRDNPKISGINPSRSLFSFILNCKLIEMLFENSMIMILSLNQILTELNFYDSFSYTKY